MPSYSAFFSELINGMFNQGAIQARLDAKVAVLSNRMDFHVTHLETIRALQKPGTAVKYHYLGFLNVYRQLPFANELLEAV